MYRSMQHKLATGHLEYLLLHHSVGPSINSDGHLFVNVLQTMSGDWGSKVGVSFFVTVFLPTVVKEFCRISLEFIRKGSNPRVYQTAARELCRGQLSSCNVPVLIIVIWCCILTFVLWPLTFREAWSGCWHCLAWSGGVNVPTYRVLKTHGEAFNSVMVVLKFCDSVWKWVFVVE